MWPETAAYDLAGLGEELQGCKAACAGDDGVSVVLGGDDGEIL